MSEPFYVARARIAKIEGVHRRATLTDGTEFDMGVPETRETVERALERHQSKCPTAQSLSGAIEVRWTADVRE